MKKSILPPETEHNVDIAPAQTRSDGNGRGNPATAVTGRRAKNPPKIPSKPAPPRHQVVVDAEGYRSVVRRSPRGALSSEEDHDFQPEAPAKRPKTASAASRTPRPSFALLQQFSEGDSSFGAEGPDVAGAVSGDVSEGPGQVRFSFSSDSSVQNLSPPSCDRPKAKAPPKPRASKKTAKSVVGAAKDSTPSKAQGSAPSPLSSPEEIKAPSAPALRQTALTAPYSSSDGEDAPGFEQTLLIRETSVQGDCVFDAIRTALAMRMKSCDWTFLRPVPPTNQMLREALCDFAAANRDTVLPYGHFPSVFQVVEEDYLSGAKPIRDDQWERDEYARTGVFPKQPGRFIRSFDDYVAAMRSPTANGDELMVSLASIFFGVRVLVLGSRSLHGQDFWALQADYHPPSVHRSRHIVLVHVPGHYHWAHPAKDDCFGQHGCGRICGRITISLSEWLELWTRLPRDNSRAAHAAAGRRWNVAGGGILPGDRPDCAMEGPSVDHFLAAWPNPSLRPSQQQPPKLPTSLSYSAQAQTLVQLAAERDVVLALDDAAAILFFTRGANNEADLQRALTYLPGGVHNPINAEATPPAPVLGKRALANSQKRKDKQATMNSTDGGSGSDSDSHGHGGNDNNGDDSSKPDGGGGHTCSHALAHSADAHPSACPCAHTPHCPCTSEGDDDDPETRAKTLAEKRDRERDINQRVAAELQLRQQALETIQQITGASLSAAIRALERNMHTTADMQEAITVCCRELHPASKQYTFLEANLGEGVRPLSTRETAAQLARQQVQQSSLINNAAPPSALHPTNLNQRFLDSARQHLHNDELPALTHAQRAAVATRRAAHDQWEEAIDAQTAHTRALAAKEPCTGAQDIAVMDAAYRNGFHTPRPDIQAQMPARKSVSTFSHPSPAVRMAMAREETMANGTHGMHAPIVVVGGGATKLPLWLPGEESQNKGFYWSVKQNVQNAWRQYMLSEGQYAPRTFKSLISQQLVPAICADCDISPADWEHISDSALLEKIEARLKPKNSADVINKLRELAISSDTSKGTLSQRYRVFAESFLQRLSEAQECGCTLAETAVKNTFTRAIRQEPALESFVSEEKWTTVWGAHRRIVERLREYDAWAVYDAMQHPKAPTTTTAAAAPNTQPQHSKPEQSQRRHWDGSRQHQTLVNALSNALKSVRPQPAAQHPSAPHAPPAQQREQVHNLAPHVPAPAPQFQQQYPPRQSYPPYEHPGLDARGTNWHFQSRHIRCRAQPCTDPFCQICGFHGHTAAECKKRRGQVPGINLHGYFQESKPNSDPVRYEFQFSAPPPRVNHVAPAAEPAPPFPHPHFVNNARAGGGTPSPNNTASRSQPAVHQERQGLVNQANQTQPDSSAQSPGGGSANTQ